MSRESIEHGYLLGICGKPLPVTGGKKEPVAYLYNGARMPDIYSVYTPEVQKTYPYAYISILYRNVYRLTVTQSPLHYGTIGEQMNVYAEAGTYGTFGCAVGDNVWSNPSEFNGEAYAVTDLIWTNHPVVSDVDGKVYFAASDPIPVYE